MTPRERELVKRSWRQIGPDAVRLAELFYSRLFDMAPPLRQLFRGDMTQQQQRLATMLNTLVEDIDRADELRPVLRDLGLRHAAYHVREDDYAVFGEALMWALQRVLWSEFTPETEEAWRSAFKMMAGEMTAGARAG
jgi:hemoglobin-like flavoprotein